MRFLLDTNVISEIGKPRPNSRVLTWLLEHEAASGVPSVALAERYQGAYRVASAAR
jgi:predicted nucleic acid-binding protein